MDHERREEGGHSGQNFFRPKFFGQGVSEEGESRGRERMVGALKGGAPQGGPWRVQLSGPNDSPQHRARNSTRKPQEREE